METTMTHIARTALAAVALAAGIALAAPAQAADLYRGPSNYTVKAPPGGYSWAGPYIGGNLGYAWGGVTNNPTDPSGLLGGVQGGINWQIDQWVIGAEADLQLTGAEDTFAPWKFSNPWFGTLRARAGYAMNNFLVYVTGGLAFGTLEGQNLALSESHSALGWTLGLGAEYGITQNWSVKAEYLYVDLADRGYTITGTTNGYEFNVLRLGVNYRF